MWKMVWTQRQMVLPLVKQHGRCYCQLTLFCVADGKQLCFHVAIDIWQMLLPRWQMEWANRMGVLSMTDVHDHEVADGIHPSWCQFHLPPRQFQFCQLFNSNLIPYVWQMVFAYVCVNRDGNCWPLYIKLLWYLVMRFSYPLLALPLRPSPSWNLTS